MASGRLYLNSTNGGKPIIEDCTFKALPPGQLKSMDGIVNIEPHVTGALTSASKLTGFGAGFQMPDTVGHLVSCRARPATRRGLPVGSRKWFDRTFPGVCGS